MTVAAPPSAVVPSAVAPSAVVPSAVARRGRARAVVWLRRYGPAEVAGLIAAVAGALAAAAATGGDVRIAALAGSLAETVAFYTAFVAARAREHRRPRFRVAAGVAVGLVAEFGPAELADTLLIRPAAMYAGPLLLGHLWAGVIVGKVVADIAFYVAVVLTFELLRRKQDLADARRGSGA